MRRIVPALTATLAAAMVGVPALPATAGLSGPHGLPPIVLNGSGPTPVPLKNMAMIIDTEWGPRYVAGQQRSKLTVTVSGTSGLPRAPMRMASCRRSRSQPPSGTICPVFL